MRWSIWANDSLPRDPAQLARVLGLDPVEVCEALTARVLGFFAPCDDRPERLHCPELSAQMSRLLAYRAERAASGSKGGKSSQKRRKVAISAIDKEGEAEPKAELKAPLKLAERRGEERSRDELSKGEDYSSPSIDEFVSAYESEEWGEQARISAKC